MPRHYDVFISHAGEDKAKLAVLVYEGLKRRGISAFLDERELAVAGDAVQDMADAMQTAIVGLFLLSPEFALKHYPMLELECFLRRAGLLVGEKDETSIVCPKLIPVFYRLTVAECKYSDAFSKVECNPGLRVRFDDRVKKGETSLEKVLELLTLLARHTGIENKNGIRNDDTEEMAAGRKELAEKICDEVTRLVLSESHKTDLQNYGGGRVSVRLEDGLQSTFVAPENPGEVSLDFSSTFEEGEPQTYEAAVLREVLWDGKGARVVGLVGAGGVGKSCILREVARHDLVRNQFPGGVYFISLGMDASVDTLRSELLRILRLGGGKEMAERLRDEKNVETVLEVAGKVLGRARSLFLLDDVWERNGVTGRTVAQVSGILSQEHGGVVVFTTRFSSVALKGDVIVHIESREAVSEECKRILLSYSKFGEEEIAEEGVEWVIGELLKLGGGLPVCLAVTGRGVRRLGVHLKGKRGIAWVVYWRKVRSRRDVLIWDDVDDYKGLGKTVSVALDVLEESEDVNASVGAMYTWTEMYRSLVVMKKQMVMPIEVLGRMWKVSGEGEVLMIVEGFCSVGLGEIAVDQSEGVAGLRIHDLLHDFAVCFARDKGEVREWHKRLLDGYICSREDGVREWWKYHDEKYVLENICRHLVEGGASEEVVLLLLRAEWTALRHEIGGLVMWNRDFAECLEGVENSLSNDDEKVTVRRGLCIVRDVIADCWSYVSSNRRELGYQVFGRLGDVQEGVVQNYLESIVAWHPKPWLQPVCQLFRGPGEGGPAGEFFFNDMVHDVALSIDPLLAVAGVGRAVVVADLEEMRVIMRCKRHEDEVTKVWLSDDGERALSWSLDGEVWGWKITTGEEIWMGKVEYNRGGGSDGELDCVGTAFSADGRRFALVCGDELQVWKVETFERVAHVKDDWFKGAWCVGMSPNGSRIVVGNGNGSLRMWNVSTQTQEGSEMRGHNKPVQSLTFSADGRRIASGSWGGIIRVWDPESKTQIGDPVCTRWDDVEHVALSSDGGYIVSGAENEFCVWDSDSGTQVGPVLQHSPWVRCLAISTTGRFVLSGGDEMLRIWDMEAASDTRSEPPLREDSIVCLTASADGRFLVSGSRDGTVRIWESCTGMQTRGVLRGHSDLVSCVATSPDCGSIVTGSWDNTLRVWDVASRSQVGEAIFGHSDHIECVSYSPDGELFVSGSKDGTVRIWRADNHAQVGAPIGGAVHPSSGVKFLLAQRIWEMAKSVMATIESGVHVTENNASLNEGGDETSSNGTGWSESDENGNGTRNSSSWGESSDESGDETRSNNTGRGESSVLDGGSSEGQGAVRSVLMSPDKRRIVCGLDNGAVVVWDVLSGNEVGARRGVHTFPVFHLDMCGGNEVKSKDAFSEVRWRLDEEDGLVKLSVFEDVTSPGEERMSSGEMQINSAQRCRQILCSYRVVRWGRDVTLATLPASVDFRAWHFDPSRSVLGVGLEDGRVLIFKVHM